VTKVENIVAACFFAVLAILAAAAAEIHIALACTGYPIAFIALLVVLATLWEAGRIHWGYEPEPPDGEAGMLAGLTAMLWSALVMVELLTGLGVWIAGLL